jgi:ABC-type branched-subunit amino acid transport system ATPase component
MSEVEPLLSVAGLCAGYGALPVLFDVDLDVRVGEIVALMGANGAGKTTTLRAVTGQIPATLDGCGSTVTTSRRFPPNCWWSAA